jgi:phosphate transport system substrate-binding protein
MLAVGALALNACIVQNGSPNTLTLVGAEATQNVMGAISTAFNSDAAHNKDPDNAVNVLAVQSPFEDAPADAFCGDIHWDTPAGAGEQLAPDGTGAGLEALRMSAENGDGCVDIARSSMVPRPSGTGPGHDLSTTEYYAYAMDAVSWASESSHLGTPTITKGILKQIFECQIWDWSQVPGEMGTGPIKRYWPNPGSDTGFFFQNSVLGGFDPTTVSTVNCPPVTLTDQNSGAAIAANGDTDSAIVPFSVSSWIAQNNGVVPDVRFGQRIWEINSEQYLVPSGSTFALNTAGPVQETNIPLVNPATTTPGVRYLFNVIDSTTPDYGDAKYLVGFDNSPPGGPSTPTSGQICNGSEATILTTYGYAPLDTSDPLSLEKNLLGSHCRLWQPA